MMAGTSQAEGIYNLVYCLISVRIRRWYPCRFGPKIQEQKEYPPYPTLLYVALSSIIILHLMGYMMLNLYRRIHLMLIASVASR
jgi:hypothetical protein